MYGHTEKLFVLPFDHRGSFAKGLFGTETPDAATVARIKDMKHVIYEAIFLTQRELGVPLSQMAVLVDETYGEEILRDAHAKGIQTMQSVEQSGLDEFAFQYGEDFGTHLTERHATFAKALVRYNPEGDAEANARSLERLRLLSYFCHESGIKLLIEPLIPPTSAQLASVEGDKARFDTELRPALTLEMMRQFQESHIECDIWKIEGFETSSAYVSVVAQAQNTPERAGVSIIILGRGEARVKVTEWINAGKHVPGVIGFAVGRTVFWEPLVSYRDEQLTRDETISLISKNFSEFCLLFEAS